MWLTALLKIAAVNTSGIKGRRWSLHSILENPFTDHLGGWTEKRETEGERERRRERERGGRREREVDGARESEGGRE